MRNWVRVLICALFAGFFSAAVMVNATTVGAVIGGLVFFALLFALFFVVSGMQFPEP